MKIIGVVARLEFLDNAQKHFVNQDYCKAIEVHGWAIFPIVNETSLTCALKLCDALCIPGGYDIEPSYFNAQKDGNGTYYDNAMDSFDFLCLDAFYKQDKPILGICRGMQLINVYFQGNLKQHIDMSTHAPHNLHEISIVKDTWLSKLYPTFINVNSYHHQVVDILGKPLYACAYSKEYYVEALLHQNQKILAVQWHPEQMKNDQIFAYFLDVVCA
ncbi:MAG: gamma-glutamyl-gamma-aminobutyrate hydrolase family protein [Longicatena sp.]